MWAVIFPGQGSQKIGMGQFYYKRFERARRIFELVSDELKINFKKLLFESSEKELTLTQNAQPAIVLVSCVAWECLKEEMDLGFIQYTAGHSVGEYSALVASGVLSFVSSMKAVKKRGELMSETPFSEKGGMSALMGPSMQEAKNFCNWVEENNSFSPLEVANFNSREQNVLSGNLKALQWADKHYKDFSFSREKVQLIPLKVSSAFHSSLMSSASQKMKHFLDRIPFGRGDLLIVQNTSARIEKDPELIKKNLSYQIDSPVLWLQSMEYLFKQGCDHFLELGEGGVLKGLMKKIDPSKSVFHFHSLADIKTLQNFQASDRASS